MPKQLTQDFTEDDTSLEENPGTAKIHAWGTQGEILQGENSTQLVEGWIKFTYVLVRQVQWFSLLCQAYF